MPLITINVGSWTRSTPSFVLNLPADGINWGIIPDPDLFQNFQDTEAEKAIMGSIVYCIHHKDGCKWSDELRKLKVIVQIAIIEPIWKDMECILINHPNANFLLGAFEYV